MAWASRAPPGSPPARAAAARAPGSSAVGRELITAVAVFVPLTVWGATEVNDRYDVSTGSNLLALSIAVLGHVAIVAAIGVHLARARQN